MKIKRILVIVGVLIAAATIIVAIISDIKGRKSRVTDYVNSHKPFGLYEKYFKRILDCLVASFLLVISSPVLAVLALAVRKNLGSPVLFTQDRPGKNEEIFKLRKFRTMTDDRDENNDFLPDHERLTSFGVALRKTSMDELPELVNIAEGDMSFIGPRPLLVRYLPFYTNTERKRHDVRPGLSGLAQVNGRNFLKWDDRLALDVKYVERITFLGDLKILIKTIMKVIKKEDVAEDTDAVEEYLDVERSQGNM